MTFFFIFYIREESKTDNQSSDLEERPSLRSESSSESESSISFNISSIERRVEEATTNMIK